MPPRKRAAAKKGAAAKGAKKAKKVDSQAAGGAGDDVKTKIEALKTADMGKKKLLKVDGSCPMASRYSVSTGF